MFVKGPVHRARAMWITEKIETETEGDRERERKKARVNVALEQGL